MASNTISVTYSKSRVSPLRTNDK